MEKKLYYKDAYIQTFETRITRQGIDEEGNRFIVLSETAFYPTGGGQPHDTGFINGIPVIKVEEMNGEVYHFIPEEIQADDQYVTCQIDWSRRFDHMQQHAGQHILSAAFEELFDIETVSFHLGNEIVTIDLDVEELTEEMLKRAEQRANEIILENRPIETKWITKEELAQYPVRKEPTVTESIRLVIIPNFDYNGCGGTHPRSTGEIGMIKLLKWERQRKRVRLEFVCGQRVLTELGKKQAVIGTLTQLLNRPQDQLMVAVGKLLDEKRKIEKDLVDINEQLLQFEVSKWVESDHIVNGRKMIQAIFQDRSIQELQKLARLVIKDASDCIAIFVSENEDKIQFVAAKGTDVEVDMKHAAQQTFERINGKGGGTNDFIQGGGKRILSSDEVISYFVANLNSK